VANEKYMDRETLAGKLGTRDLFSIPTIAEFLGIRAKTPRHAEIEKTNVLVTLPDHGEQRIAYSLNLLGETCLRIYLVAKKCIINARAGEVVEIMTDNLASIETIQFMAPTYDFLHLATVHDEGTWRLYLRKENGGGKESKSDDQTEDSETPG
jgi:TusA-related sulfurtransferase